MMEFLFRGKRKDNGEWVEGAFCQYDCPDPFAPAVEKPCIIKYGEPYSLFWFDVELETVGPFTGFYYKNKKKIFKGDILKSTYSDEPGEDIVCYEEIFWDNGWYLAEGGNRDRCDDLMQDCLSEYSEVVGNIWDNPELLEALLEEMK